MADFPAGISINIFGKQLKCNLHGVGFAAATVQQMLGDLVIRFLLGGAIVSSFAVLGQLVKPASLAGIFGAAPSVALVSLVLAYWKCGPGFVTIEARAMAIGGVALLVYSLLCTASIRWRKVPVWLTAGANWAAWLAVAFALQGVLRKAGAP